LGLLVGANTFRNPGLVAKLTTTLDHLSAGRAILGLGGAWFEYEHTAHGIEFGRRPGERLLWLDEAVAAVRRVLDGESVTSPAGGRYSFVNLRQEPLPVQQHLPIMIGGSGERKTLRTVARYADMWNGMGRIETMRLKVEVLERYCAEVGRDPAEIERTLGCKPIIRDSQAEAERVWRRLMEHNLTPMSGVENDPTFWVGTPEQRVSWASIRPSRRSRRRTTMRRSYASSARSSHSSIAARHTPIGHTFAGCARERRIRTNGRPVPSGNRLVTASCYRAAHGWPT